MARKLKLTKYPELKAVIFGEANTGKSALAMAISKELGSGIPYLWPTDGREREYLAALGEDNVFFPDVVSFFNVAEVFTAVKDDVRSKEMDIVNLFIMDNVTHLYQGIVRPGQKRMADKEGGGGSTTIDKANTMAVVVQAAMHSGKQFILIWHEYDAHEYDATAKKGEHLKKKRLRQSISITEVDRIDWSINLKLRTIEKNGKFGIQITYCRERPGMKSVILWDEVGMWQGMLQRIRSVLFDSVPISEPTKWDDFSKENPFPAAQRGETPLAVKLACEQFDIVNGGRIYPFGDPRAETVKLNGERGINGALRHAKNAYDKIKRGYSKEYPKPSTAGEMTEVWKKYVNSKLGAQHLLPRAEEEIPF